MATGTVNVRLLHIGAVALAVLVLHLSVFSRLRVAGVHPDALLLLAVCVGIFGGPNRGALAGFLSGLAADFYLSSPLGISALSYSGAGFLAGYLAKETNDVSWVVSVLAFGCSAFGVLAFLFIGRVIDVRSVPIGRQIWVALVISVLNALVAPLLTRGLERLWRAPRDRSWV